MSIDIITALLIFIAVAGVVEDAGWNLGGAEV